MFNRDRITLSDPEASIGGVVVTLCAALLGGLFVAWAGSAIEDSMGYRIVAINCMFMGMILALPIGLCFRFVRVRHVQVLIAIALITANFTFISNHYFNYLSFKRDVAAAFPHLGSAAAYTGDVFLKQETGHSGFAGYALHKLNPKLSDS